MPAKFLDRLLGPGPRHALPWGGPEITQSLNDGLPMAFKQLRHPFTKAIDTLALALLEKVGASAKPTATPQRSLWALWPFRMPRGVPAAIA